MADEQLKQEIIGLNQKVDLLLEYVNQQRLSARSIEDLLNDGAIIGKDIYDSTVSELDNRQVELHPDQLTNLGVSLLRNISSFNVIMNSFESIIDLSKDLSPIINESLIDFSKWMAEIDGKGYFDLMNKFREILEEIFSKISLDDLEKIQKALPQWIELFKNLSSEKVLSLAKSFSNSLNETDIDNPLPVGMLGIIKSLNDPDVKRTTGLMLSIAKNFKYQNKK